MSERPRLFTPFGITVSLLLCGGFFLFFFMYLQPFVPAQTPALVYLYSAFTSLCLTMVFFLAVFSFLAVLVDERHRKKQENQ